MKEISKLSERGIKGIIAQWMILLNLAMPLCAAGISIYWLTQISNSIWLKSVGASLFASNLVLVVLSLASFAFNILEKLNFKLFFEKMAYQLYVVITILSLVCCCVTLSLSTYTAADRAYQDIIDHCNRFPNEQYVINFSNEFWTQYSKQDFILRRTVRNNSILAVAFGVWTGVFIIFFVISFMLKDYPDNAPLLDHPQNNETE